MAKNTHEQVAEVTVTGKDMGITEVMLLRKRSLTFLV